MGILIAKKYPTTLFAKLADHTYVECGTGAKAWGCWGGKAGGTAFNSGSGSTRRADAIAGSNERAGITCYLINGVCHQAANRILFPAGILVAAARGYAVSSALFGAYGKTGFWPCRAPFDKFPRITGDLPACVSHSSALDPEITPAHTPEELHHIMTLRRAYARAESIDVSPLESISFQVRLFETEAKFRLGVEAVRKARGLRVAKERSELRHHALVEGFQQEHMEAAEFIKAFNQLTLDFQDDIANAVSKDQYSTLLKLDRDDRVLLADPQIIESLYGKAVVRAVYGEG